MDNNNLLFAINELVQRIDKVISINTNSGSDGGGVGELAKSIDKLSEAVSDVKKDGKSGDANSASVLGIIAGALTGSGDKLKDGASLLKDSIGEVISIFDSLKADKDKVIVNVSDISSGLTALVGCVDKIGIRTVISAKIAKLSLPALTGFIEAINEALGKTQIDSNTKKQSYQYNKLVGDTITSLSEAAKSITKYAPFFISGKVVVETLVPMFIKSVSKTLFNVQLEVDNHRKQKAKNKDSENTGVLGVLGKDLIELSKAAFAVTLAAPFFISGAVASVAIPIFVHTLSNVLNSLDSLANRESKRKKGSKSFIGLLCKDIFEIGKAALVVTLGAPVFLLASAALPILGLFLGSINLFVIKPLDSMNKKNTIGKMAKNFMALSLGLLAAGLTAATAALLAPVFLVGSIGMLAGWVFLKATTLFMTAAGKGIGTFLKGSLGLIILGAGLLAATALFTMTFAIGRELANPEALAMFGNVLLISTVAGLAMGIIGQFIGLIAPGALACVLIAGSIYATSYLLNKAAKENAEMFEDVEAFSYNMLGLLGAVTLLGTAITAMGFALPFILPGIAAVGLVAGSVYATAVSLSRANEAWLEVQESGLLKLDANNETPFGNTLKSVIKSVTDVIKDIDDVGQFKDALDALNDLTDFISNLAEGVSEFSKIALLKGEISDGKGGKIPFDLTKVGEGIAAVVGSVVGGTADAMKQFDFTEDNLVEVETGFAFWKKKTKIPKQLAAISFLMPLADFISNLAEGVSEFSKIALLKGDIIDGSGRRVPFDLSKVGEGIASVVGSIIDGTRQALEAFDFTENNLVEVETGFAFWKKKTKIPKQLAAMQHLMPLADFVSKLAEGISEFSKIATGSGTISVLNPDTGKREDRPFNLTDVGLGISNIIRSIMTGISDGLAELEEGGMVEITTGGFFGIGGDKIMVPARLASLQHISPLVEFVSSIANLAGNMGKDENGQIIQTDFSSLKSLFVSLIDIFNVDGIEDILERAADGLDALNSPLEDLADDIRWDKMPKEEEVNSLMYFVDNLNKVQIEKTNVERVTTLFQRIGEVNWKNYPTEDRVSTLTGLFEYITDIDEKKVGFITTGSEALNNLSNSLVSENNILGDKAEVVSKSIKSSVDAVNTLDEKKAKALAGVYDAMAKAATKRSAFKELINVIKESTDILSGKIETISPQVNVNNSTTNVSSLSGINTNNLSKAEKDKLTELQKREQEIKEREAKLSKTNGRVSVDLTINGQGGDRWIVSRK